MADEYSGILEMERYGSEITRFGRLWHHNRISRNEREKEKTRNGRYREQGKAGRKEVALE